MHEQPRAVHAWRLYGYIKMSTPRFYSWDDDGSPGRALTGNLQNKWKQILVPCLVTGYGDKPGAGWTLEHEHANGFTLSNGQNYINFVSNLPAIAPYPAMSTESMHVYVAESLTGTSGAVIEGANLCSGKFRAGITEEAGYPRHCFWVNPVFSGLSTVKWLVLATNDTVVISCSSDSALVNTGYQFSIFFGNVLNDIEGLNSFTVLGGGIANYSGYAETRTLTGSNTSPRNMLTGLAEFSQTLTEPFQTFLATFRVNTPPAQLPSKLSLQSPRVKVNDLFVGTLPGVAYDDVFSIYAFVGYLRGLGITEDTFSNRYKVVTIDGFQYAGAPGFNGGFIMTNNPAFW